MILGCEPARLRRLRRPPFDCYGTLIDWETGIVTALRDALGDAATAPSDEELLAALRRTSSTTRRRRTNPPATRSRWRSASIAGSSHPRRARRRRATFGASVGDLPAFPDSTDALTATGTRYQPRPRSRSATTTCFGAPRRAWGSTFDDVITAQQVGTYKPDTARFPALAARAHSARRRSGCCTWPRACSTTTCRPSRLGMDHGLDPSACRRPGAATP